MIEIERKFLPISSLNDIKKELTRDGYVIRHQHIEQVYLKTTTKQWGMRIRKIKRKGVETHVLTMKSKIQGRKFSVVEIETSITKEQYHAMATIENSQPLRKRRWIAHHPDHTHTVWFIDKFEDIDLMLLEVEIDDEIRDIKPYAFLGKEVTGKKRYSNAKMFQRMNIKP